MAVYRDKATGDLVDAWMHSVEEDKYTLAFPTWVYVIWENGTAYTDQDGNDFLKTSEGDVALPDGHYIVRKSGDILSVVAPEVIHESYSYES